MSLAACVGAAVLLCFVAGTSKVFLTLDHLIIMSIQSSYLSQISQIISVKKNLSCGEISDFCKKFEQFMEFYHLTPDLDHYEYDA